MTLKELGVVLGIASLMGVGIFAGASSLISQANLKNLRDAAETAELVHTSSLTSTVAFEIANGQDGGIFEIPSSNTFQPIVTWESPNDMRDLYTFTIASNMMSVAKKNAADITSATIKTYASMTEDPISLSTAQLEMPIATKKEVGIVPIVRQTQNKIKEQLLLSLLSMKESYLEPFILRDAKTITAPSGSVTLDSGLTMDSILTAVFGTANEKKTVTAGETHGLLQLSVIGENQLEEVIGKKGIQKYNDYNFFTISSRQSTQVMRETITKTLLGSAKTYSGITPAEKELIDDVVQGIDYMEISDIIVIPTKDNKILYDKDKTAYFGSKGRIIRNK